MVIISDSHGAPQQGLHRAVDDAHVLSGTRKLPRRVETYETTMTMKPMPRENYKQLRGSFLVPLSPCPWRGWSSPRWWRPCSAPS